MANPRYNIIVKVGENDFKKWRAITDLLRFTLFIDKNYPKWRFFNVYDGKTKAQIGSFTQKKKPLSRFVTDF